MGSNLEERLKVQVEVANRYYIKVITDLNNQLAAERKRAECLKAVNESHLELISHYRCEAIAERKRAEVAERKKDTLLAALQRIRTGTEDPFAHGVAFDVLELMKECQ